MRSCVYTRTPRNNIFENHGRTYIFENHGVEHDARVLKVAVAKAHEVREGNSYGDDEAHEPGTDTRALLPAY